MGGTLMYQKGISKKHNMPSQRLVPTVVLLDMLLFWCLTGRTYCMGDEADNILRGHDLTDAQRQQYASVKATFETYFVPKKKRNI